MKYIVEKRNYIILFIIILLLLLIVFYPKRKPFVKTYRTHGIITIVIYDEIDEDKIDSKIRKICKNYKKESHEIQDIIDDDMDAAYIAYNIIDFFKSENISRYIINENGNISAGKNLDKGKNLVSINDPGSGDILNTFNIRNESMATISYEGNYDSVVVLHKNNVWAYALAKYLSDKDFDESKEICKKYSCEVYFLKDDKVDMTDGFKKNINS